MKSCTNDEPRYFGTKTCHVNANAFTIQTMGVHMPPRVPLLIGRCRLSKRVSRREACEQTAAPADREACEQAAVQAHREASPLTRLRRPPSSQLPPLLMVPAPQFKSPPHSSVSLQSSLLLSDSPIIYLQPA
jgi:hypothetical protein